MQEEATWLFILVMTLVYIGHRVYDPKPQPKMTVAPSAQNELDPTRWRHDGSQPLQVRNGNRAPTYYGGLRPVLQAL